MKKTPDDDVLSKLFRSVGRHSRYAGLGFIAVSIAFLILSVSDQFVVFEVDSVVAFLAAIFLLFRDPRGRVQAGVLDAVLISSDKAIAELTAFSDAGFIYVPTGNGVEDVVVIPADFEAAPIPNGLPPNTSSLKFTPSLVFTPPGRGLAELYKRGLGLKYLTMDALEASLSETMSETFGLASSVDIDSKDDGIEITLHGASTTCSCGDSQVRTATGGSIGCTLASFLAVVVATATKKSVSLKRCVRETGVDALVVSMSFGPEFLVSK